MRDMQRSKQLAILHRLEEHYPNAVDSADELCQPEDRWIIHYLNEHELIEAHRSEYLGGVLPAKYHTISLTARGLDFLADDGGLSATLGIVTVKYHEDTLRELIKARISDGESLPEDQKSRLLEAIQKLPADGIGLLSKELLGRGIDYLPTAIHTVRAALGI
ncbi:hypothetical protein [Carnimonas bestiolae]|uniref:hypothetical protein n=1 Tax=Carnimonas bestiolae TaxID=3402172 RepID=UPI003F4ADB61